MHEMSLAQSLMSSVLREMEKHNATKVLEIRVEIGELMQLDRPIFVEALTSLLEGPKLDGARLDVGVEKANFTCGRCSSKWGMEEAKKQLEKVAGDLLVEEPDSKELPLHFLPELYPAFVHCPNCGSSDVFLSEGGAIKVSKLVLKTGE
jgi:hydrogenase nickel incorporation protein HypA/HybF